MKGKRAGQSQALEAILARHLGRVVAPEELWYRLQNASCGPVSRAGRRIRWGMAFLLFLAMLAGGFQIHRRQSSVSTVAAPLWAQMSERLEFQSSQATKIRDWVQVRTGLDIPLCAEPSDKVQLVGARLGKGARSWAAIAYQVNHHAALLLVSKLNSPSTDRGEHHVWTEQPKGNKQMISWTMHGQSYRLAWAAPGDSRDACGVCHSQVEQLAVLN